MTLYNIISLIFLSCVEVPEFELPEGVQVYGEIYNYSIDTRGGASDGELCCRLQGFR